LKLVRTTVDEHRRRADQRDRLGAGGKAEGRHEHGITRADALRHQDQKQGIRAARAADCVAHADIFGKRHFELPDLRSHDEATVLEHPGDPRLDPAAKASALGFEIDERKAWPRRRRHGASPEMFEPDRAQEAEMVGSDRPRPVARCRANWPPPSVVRCRL
jgi:hypothetical protein